MEEAIHVFCLIFSSLPFCGICPVYARNSRSKDLGISELDIQQAPIFEV